MTISCRVHISEVCTQADFKRKEFAMIATHNIKVNGRWIHAGEEYEPEAVVTTEHAEEPAKPEVQAEPAEEAEKKAEEKPKTASRRKKISE